MLTLHDEALAALTTPKIGGTVRFGAPEDYASHFLPQALKRFSAAHPMVEVVVYCDATPRLRQQFADGKLDVMLTTEEDIPGPNRRRIELTWIVAEQGGPLDASPLPLALFHSGCPYRRNALLSLEKAGISYRIAYSSPSMTGVMAAVQAGLAVAPATEVGIGIGCRKATLRDGMPPIDPVAIGLHIDPAEEDEAVRSFHAFIGHELGMNG